MSVRTNPNLLLEMKKYGDVNIESCFNCGNCTAVCPLTTDNESFPRRMIRFAQLGLQQPLLSSKELWLCYYCGECTKTCPRQADPAEYMATARRYAIAHYDRTGLAKLLYTTPGFSIFFLTLLAVIFGWFMYTTHGPMAGDALSSIDFITPEAAHLVIFIIIIVLGGLWGTVMMVAQVGKVNRFPKGVRLNWLGALWEAVGIEALGQKRYRGECESYTEPQPWYLQKWFVHASIMWGFLGLMAASLIDLVFNITEIKALGDSVPIWYPVRLLGTIAGLLILYGTSVALIKRIRKTDESTSHSTLSDWVFLILLWFSGVSGFGLEISLYLPEEPVWSNWISIFHIAVAMELIILAPFTKFAHAFCRTVALYFHALKPISDTNTE
ncbi:MAG: 4Fe-4S dicluster domain-containing protein [Deltaproteobacteria bacterium]|nr:4Fe-4S dicluster domain-containing protein [Candidatus Tharpella sp.]